MIDFLFSGAVMVKISVALVAALMLIASWRAVGRMASRFLRFWRALPLLGKVVLPVCLIVFYLHGSIKQTHGVINRIDKGGGEIYSVSSGYESVGNSVTGGINVLTLSAESLRISAFGVDQVNRAFVFEASWSENLFNNTLSRNLHLFSSTNLLEKHWLPLGEYLMPSGTNMHSFVVSEEVVIDSARSWFYGLFNQGAFFCFGIDVDSDSDGLTDSCEKLYAHTDPANPDTDGDSILDGVELDHGLNPNVSEASWSDYDGDGLTHSQELDFGSNPLMADSDGDGLDDDVEWRYGWNPNWPGETDEANAPGGMFTTFDRPFTAKLKFENPYPDEATVYDQGEGESFISLGDLVTRDQHKDTASTVTNNIISVETLGPKPIFTTNVTGVLMVKLRCDDYGVLKIGDLVVTNSWPNTDFAKAWKVIEANTTNEVDVSWDSRGGSKWNFEYECYFYPEILQRYSIDLDVDSDNDGIIEDNEDSIEDLEGKPGKALYLNELDKDYDGIPDYADGYDIDFGTGSQALNNVSGSFASMRLSINGPQTNGFVKLVCVDADSTANVTRSGDGTITNEFVYSKADSKIRIWKKDGVSARTKAPFPEGDLMQVDTLYDVTKLLDSGVGEFFIEAINGSENLGDVTITAEFYPAQNGCGKVEDKVKLTVFSIEAVHPIATDFAADSIGKVMISTKQDAPGTNRYYTVNPTTARREGAQTKDANVTISAYIKPVPTDPIPNLSVRFELVDPDDLSHYEGKAEAGTPSVQGDVLPNDNNDPNCRMSYSDLNLCGYSAFQTRLSTSSTVPAVAVYEAKTNYIAETVLSITDRYSGDNYRVRATLADNFSLPFDTLSNIDANAKVYRSSIKESETLIAWKRVYIEQDEMYKKGCTITENFEFNTNSLVQYLFVDSTNDFHSVGTNVIVFWKGGEAAGVSVEPVSSDKVLVRGLTNSVPKYSGVRIVGEEETYTVDRRFLPNAFGCLTDGSDGGAFIEFKLLNNLRNVNDRIPKWLLFQRLSDLIGFMEYWFDDKVNNRNNVLYISVASRFKYNGLDPYGMSNRRRSTVVLFSETATSLNQLNDTLVHEIGHRHGLKSGVGGIFNHIDSNDFQFTHCRSDSCLMSYARDRNDNIVEFCTNCLQSIFLNVDGLRIGKDQ